MSGVPTLEEVLEAAPTADFHGLVTSLVAAVHLHAIDAEAVPQELLIDLAFAADCEAFDADLRAAARVALAAISTKE